MSNSMIMRHSNRYHKSVHKILTGPAETLNLKICARIFFCIACCIFFQIHIDKHGIYK